MSVKLGYYQRDEATLQREVNALVALHSLYPLKKAMIVTYEDEGELECKGLKIEIVPVWKWVLENGDCIRRKWYDSAFI